ncbi:hypothetical protein EV188_102102 [Actinomycetospora succinea]|uniref:Uncharacterized protein n=1 Tax=Actinomycetospora succinea TaxID=663603 RepID=A0A4R6VGN0_9PSEU|nr:hypothetical protein [Actinomycetospora succinea]TDQ62448.1 hypothetical protein EV188_102102 [Actinomycetospora succinea]
MWHLHWRAEVARTETLRPDLGRTDTRRTEKGRTKSGSFQRVWHDTPAAHLAAEIPESVRVRGR